MRDFKKVGILTSGGDAPGMNAAIRSVVRTARYYELDVMGILGGYRGLIEGTFKDLTKADVGNILHRGGTILKTARSEEFTTSEGRIAAYENLRKNEIDALICIGGNGTYAGAKIFSEEFDFPLVGIPGTIDNDLFGTDNTIGFDTALNTAIEAIDRIRDTADSHNRLFFIEVMGRRAGFIALHTGIGSGAGNIFLPETSNTVEGIIQWLQETKRRKKLFNLVIVAEGNKTGGAMEIAEIVGKRVPTLETRVTIIGHLQRGGSPSCHDRVLASRLGYAAVNALLDGQKNIGVGIVDNKIKYTPFGEAINNSKTLDHELVQIAKILAT